MSDAIKHSDSDNVVRFFGPQKSRSDAFREPGTQEPGKGGGNGGGGSMDDVVRRVGVLEKDMGEIRSLLKDLKDGQHAAALEASSQRGDLNTRLAEFSGKLTTLDTKSDGLRRDLDKLPTEYAVAKIFVFVVGGLGATAALLKLGLPVLVKALG